MNKVYLKSRYDKGEAAYLNCPMTKQEFMDFHEALVNAEEARSTLLKKKSISKVVCQLKSWPNEVSKPCSMVL